MTNNNDLIEDNSRVPEDTELISALTDALIWASGSADFSPGGKARIGWLKVAQPALDAALKRLPDTFSSVSGYFESGKEDGDDEQNMDSGIDK